MRWGLKEAWSKDAGKRTCDFIGTFESSGALGHKELDRYLARQNACGRLEWEEVGTRCCASPRFAPMKISPLNF